jgi:hypothetical protein
VEVVVVMKDLTELEDPVVLVEGLVLLMDHGQEVLELEIILELMIVPHLLMVGEMMVELVAEDRKDIMVAVEVVPDRVELMLQDHQPVLVEMV